MPEEFLLAGDAWSSSVRASLPAASLNRSSLPTPWHSCWVQGTSTCQCVGCWARRNALTSVPCSPPRLRPLSHSFASLFATVTSAEAAIFASLRTASMLPTACFCLQSWSRSASSFSTFDDIAAPLAHWRWLCLSRLQLIKVIGEDFTSLLVPPFEATHFGTLAFRAPTGSCRRGWLHWASACCLAPAACYRTSVRAASTVRICCGSLTFAIVTWSTVIAASDWACRSEPLTCLLCRRSFKLMSMVCTYKYIKRYAVL